MAGKHSQIQVEARLPKSRLPITVIGAGGIVTDAHLPAYRKAGFPISGIFDVNQDRAAAAARQFEIDRVYSTLEEAVASAPGGAAFDVATPPAAFLKILPQLPDGAAVLLQKPMGEDLDQAFAIRDLCRRKRFTAAVNFQLRYAPGILGATSLIEQGVIGEIHDMEVRVTVHTPWHLWTFLEAVPRLEILNHSVHYLDLIRSFLGDPAGVYAKTVKHPKTPALAATRSNIILDYGEMLRANVTTNHGHEYGQRHQESYVKWEGDKGAIKCRLGLLMNYPKGVADEFEYCILKPDVAPEWLPIPIEGSWFPDGFIGSMASLMCFVEGSSDSLATSVDDACKTMAVVEAAYQSNSHGGTPVLYD